MNIRWNSRSLLGIAWLAMAGSLCAGPFVMPMDGPVVFRSDRIPLEVATMRKMSENLVDFADSVDADTAENSRAVAQMLGLAMMLNPANSKARELLMDFKSERHEANRNNERLQGELKQMWRTLNWLDSDEAGQDAKALAACLKDILIFMDPAQAKEKNLFDQGGYGAWSGWVADLVAFQDVPKIKPQPQVPSPAPKPVVAKWEMRLDRAQIYTPLWSSQAENGEVSWVQKSAPISVQGSLSTNDPSAPFSISIGRSEAAERWEGYANWIRGILARNHRELPKGLRVLMTGPEFEQSLQARGNQSLSPAIALLANAVISGRDVDAIVVGKLDSQGNYKNPQYFMEKIQALGPGKGQRLVVPEEAAADLEVLLVMDQADFFLQYEVITASTFDQLVERTLKDATGSLLAATQEFKLIQQHAGDKSFKHYIANSFVKKRLTTVAEQCPSHLSAKMLLLQAYGKKPLWLSRKSLAVEIIQILSPVGKMERISYYDFAESQKKLPDVGALYDQIKKKLEQLQQYAQFDDRELIKRCDGLMRSLRDLDRAISAKGDFYSVASERYRTSHEVASLHKDLVQQYQSETGDGSRPKSD